MKRIAILGSGNGSNAENICNYFQNHSHIQIGCIIYNRKNAYIAQRAERLNIPCAYFSREQFSHANEVLEYLQSMQIDYIVLAGFLQHIPEPLVDTFNNKILNIHPSLLPKYGGKGMYGDYVHQEVLNHHEQESGITIHLVNQHYDKGDIVFQTQCPVLPNDSVDTLAQRVHALEYRYFPQIIENYIQNN